MGAPIGGAGGAAAGGNSSAGAAGGGPVGGANTVGGGATGTAGAAGMSAGAGTDAGGKPSEGGSGGGFQGPSVGAGVGSCPVNLALKMPTMPSPTASLVDGDYATPFNFHGGGSFYIDFGASTEVGRATVVPHIGHTWSNSYTYSISDDALTWTQVDQMDSLAYLPIERAFPAATGRYFKVSINGAAWPEGAIENEVEVYAPGSSTDNLAQGKPVTANYQQEVPQATDGDLATSLDLSGGKGFLAPSPAWTTVDLGENRIVNRVRYYSSIHASTNTYDIAVSDDNTTWTTVVQVDGDGYDSFSNYCFAQQNIRYVRVTVPTVRPQDASGPGTEVREIQVFGPGSKL